MLSGQSRRGQAAARPSARPLRASRGRQRLNSVANAGTEPGTFRYATERLYIDVIAEYKFTRRLALFMNLRILNDATEATETYGPNTPHYARLRNITDFYSLWTFGLKGNF